MSTEERDRRLLADLGRPDAYPAPRPTRVTQVTTHISYDGHGDLRLEHVYFEGDADPIAIDCVEFSDRLRHGDAASDVAFLAMELTARSRRDLAEGFLAAYAREAGNDDLYAVVGFYVGYRAWVRGKVAAFLAADPSTPAERRYDRVARRGRACRPGRPRRLRGIPRSPLPVRPFRSVLPSSSGGYPAQHEAAGPDRGRRARRRRQLGPTARSGGLRLRHGERR